MSDDGGSAHGRCAIGIDLGGTKIAAGLVTVPAGKILYEEVIATQPQRGGAAVLHDTVELARRLRQHAAGRGLEVSGVGVGIAELVNLQGDIASDFLIKWRDLPARQALEAIAPTRFESDARAPALAEARLGAGAAYRNFIYLTIGTGISYCLVLEGRPYAGAHGNAIIAGSGLLSSQCQQCGARLETSLEDFASGPALVRRYNQGSGAGLAAGAEVTAAAAAGDGIAQAVVSSAAAAIGNTAGFLVNALDPEAVIVAGGLGLAGGLFWEQLIESTRRRIWADEQRQLPIIPARLGLRAGMVGAALIAPD